MIIAVRVMQDVRSNFLLGQENYTNIIFDILTPGGSYPIYTTFL